MAANNSRMLFWVFTWQAPNERKPNRLDQIFSKFLNFGNKFIYCSFTSSENDRNIFF